jgi:dTDP-4-dehydrorhamnose reductase
MINKHENTYTGDFIRSGPSTGLELWGGVEASLARIGDSFSDQFIRGGHHERADEDLEKIAALGIRTLRYPIGWERICPTGDLTRCDWAWTDARLQQMRELGIRPIATLLHHGSGPMDTRLDDPAFPEKLAAFARAAAERYPWVMDWTPVNEPLTTARFSGLYGHWFPHGNDELTFARCLFGELKGTVLAMRAIREVIPGARLIQTEDLGKTYSTPTLDYQAHFENERRWASFDLLSGTMTPHSRMGGHFQWVGIDEADLRWFVENPCPPDVLGINHYLTSERFLDDRLERYPAHLHGGNGMHRYADVEAIRVLHRGCAGAGTLLLEAWERFGLPVAITEAHLGCTREEQMRWLAEVWDEARWAREVKGADVRAVTVWSLLGAWDWDSLLTENRGSYEPGVFDARSKEGGPRPTGLASVCRALATTGEAPDHPALDAPGWWRRDRRLIYPPEMTVGEEQCPTRAAATREAAPRERPLLITGARGALGDALRRLCEERGLACVALSHDDCDIASPTDIERALDTHHPWAVLNAAGYVNVGLAESEPYACFRTNIKGAANLAVACARRALPLVAFSSALVLEAGAEKALPLLESDPIRPVGVYARSKAAMEEAVRHAHPGALIVRSSALFGPWDSRNFVTRALQGLSLGHTVYAAEDDYLTPAYLPEFAHVVLDLLIDGATGLWHLGHPEPISRADMIRRVAEYAGLDTRRLLSVPLAEIERGGATGAVTHGPHWAVLGSERTAPLLKSLDPALRHYAHVAAPHWTPRVATMPEPVTRQPRREKQAVGR